MGDKPTKPVKPPTNSFYGNCSTGNVELVKRLAKTLKPNEIDQIEPEFGKTALHAASLNGHIDVVKFLLQIGANTQIRDKEGKLPIEVASNAEIRSLLQSADKSQVN